VPRPFESCALREHRDTAKLRARLTGIVVIKSSLCCWGGESAATSDLISEQEFACCLAKQSLSRYLRNARIERGLSVADLAERVGVSQASIYFWEADRVRPREANLSALCKALKLPIRRAREIAAA
jgi:DNA-binding XRE family transcriptional regulator